VALIQLFAALVKSPTVTTNSISTGFWKTRFSAINAKLPRACLVINRATVHINAAREILRDNFIDYIGNREGN
jgi:hypothetical protein